MPSGKTDKSPSLAHRLILTFVVVLFASLLFFLAMVSLFTSFGDTSLDERLLESESQRMLETLIFDDAGNPLSLPPEVSAFLNSMQTGVLLRVVDAKGQVRMTGGGTGEADVLSPPGHAFNSGLRLFSVRRHGQEYFVITRPIAGHAPGYFMQLAMSQPLLDYVRGRVTVIPLVMRISIAVAVVLLLLASAMFTVRRMLRPILKISADAAAITPDKLQKRLPMVGIPAEIKPLVTAFNAALDRLESGFRGQQEFLATTAHELKTPLALLRAGVEMARELPVRETLLADIDQIARQVSQLLHLAEVRDVRSFRFEILNADDVAREAITFLQRLAERRGVVMVLSVSGAEHIPITADHGSLFILLKNLLENAIFHSPPESQVSVLLTEKSLVVRDLGEGIDPAHADLLFNRFWRAPMRRTQGSGLGLAICREVADAHGWSLGVRPGVPGAEFIVSWEQAGGRPDGTAMASPAAS